MKILLTLLTLLMTTLSVSVRSESELGIALSSDMAAFDYAHTKPSKGSRWGIGVLYNDSNSSSVAHFSFNVVGSSGVNGDLHTGLGLKAAVHDTFQTASSLGLGGGLRFEPESWAGFGVEGHLYYAPSMLNTNDADQYFDLLARVTYRVNQQARVYLGWSQVRVDYDDSVIKHVDIDQSARIGFILTF